MTSVGRFLGELKQRNVIRVAGVYAVTTWGVFQIVNNLFPVLNMPKWTLTLVAVLMMIGFPIAMVIAWAFEKGPDGVRRTATAEGPPPKFVLTDWLLLLALAAIVAVTIAQLSGAFGRTGTATPAAAGKTAAAVSGKSIAVLPFVSMSESKETEFFADGLTEEVINSLANLPDLKVAGRTSSFYFKGKNTDLREIGRQLGVAHVLEGSVRRDGQRIRITAQLIKVADGFHMWSQTYDRDLSDALAIQTEIANTVAGVLKTKLQAEQESTPQSPEAYRLALVAKGHLRRLGLENLQAARAIYQKAIAADPNNADAQAGFAMATTLLAQNHLALDFEEARRQSEGAIGRALASNPRSVDAYIAQGFLNEVLNLRSGDPRFSRQADGSYRKALDIEPKNPDAITYYGSYLSGEGRTAEAIPLLRRALEVDPLNRLALISLAGALSNGGKIDEATQMYRSVINLYPDFVDAPERLGAMLASRGRLDEAEPWLRQAARSKADPSAALSLAHLYFNLGMDEDGRAVLAGIKEPPVAVGVARAIGYARSSDFRGLIDFSQANYARDKDPFWLSAIMVAAMQLHDYSRAVDQIRIVAPDLLGPNPSVAGGYDVPLYAAHALGQIGLKDQARRIATKVLEATQPKPGQAIAPVHLVRRSQAYAELGDREHALAELRSAVKMGYRSVIMFDDFLRLERNPSYQGLANDPQFRAIIAEIDADNARMRQKVLAARGGRPPA